MKKSIFIFTLILSLNQLLGQEYGVLSSENLYSHPQLVKSEVFRIVTLPNLGEFDTTLVSVNQFENGTLVESTNYQNGRVLRTEFEFAEVANQLSRATTHFYDSNLNCDTMLRWSVVRQDKFGNEYFRSSSDSSGSGIRNYQQTFYHNEYDNSGKLVFKHGIFTMPHPGWQEIFRRFEYNENGYLTHEYYCEDERKENCVLQRINTYNEKGLLISTELPNQPLDSVVVIYNEFDKVQERIMVTQLPWEGEQTDIYSYEYDNLNRRLFERHQLIQTNEFITLRKYHYKEN